MVIKFLYNLMDLTPWIFFGLDLSSSLESNNNYSAGNTPVGVDGYAGERHNGAQGTQDDSSAGGWSDEASDPALPG